jgi:hypothetical protein
MISIPEQENNEMKKLYDRLNQDTWGMVEVLPYLIESLNPLEKYNLMQALDEKKKELEAEGEI